MLPPINDNTMNNSVFVTINITEERKIERGYYPIQIFAR